MRYFFYWAVSFCMIPATANPINVVMSLKFHHDCHDIIFIQNLRIRTFKDKTFRELNSKGCANVNIA